MYTSMSLCLDKVSMQDTIFYLTPCSGVCSLNSEQTLINHFNAILIVFFQYFTILSTINKDFSMRTVTPAPTAIRNSKCVATTHQN